MMSDDDPKVSVVPLLIIVISLLVILGCIGYKVHDKKVVAKFNNELAEQKLLVLQNQLLDVQNNPQITYITEEMSNDAKQDVIDTVIDRLPRLHDVATDCLMVTSNTTLSLQCDKLT